MIFEPHMLIPIAYAQEAVQSTSPVAVLGLNLKLFIAQLVNFGIVLFILWKWVFTPVTAALQKRTEKIEASLKTAEKVTKDKEDFEKWKAEQMVNTRHEASVILSKAEEQANKAKDEILKQTHSEQQKAIEQAKKQIEMEKNQAMASAKSELADLVTMTTEKIIRQKMDKKGDEEMVKEMLKNL